MLVVLVVGFVSFDFFVVLKFIFHFVSVGFGLFGVTGQLEPIPTPSRHFKPEHPVVGFANIVSVSVVVSFCPNFDSCHLTFPYPFGVFVVLYTYNIYHNEKKVNTNLQNK